jgi:hypothetical protein
MGGGKGKVANRKGKGEIKGFVGQIRCREKLEEKDVKPLWI